MSILKRAIIPLVLVGLLVAAGFAMFSSEPTKTLTAHFPRSVSLYEGSEVKVLGVAVGNVDQVTPSGTEVVVTMHYDADVNIPEDAEAVIIAPSIVGDRFVQLTPVYEKGDEVLADGAELSTERTSVPLELDEIYASLDDLNVALGPNGANRKGALTDLLETTAANFGGQGKQFHQTILDFSKLSETLDDNKEELFGSTAELENFVSTLAANDTTVRQFNKSLSNVSDLLAGEREELAASLKNLSIGLGHVARFVKDNKAVLSRNIKGINRVAKVLVRQRAALEETLTAAPIALNNLALTYNPQAGTLDTNSNLPESFEQDPSALLCSFLSPADPNGELCDVVDQILPRAAALGVGAGTGSSSAERFDLTLGGLVEVDQ
jgi:phospholipid/cholesterol/gamma-HCH transport system substrate-binding protein